MGGVGGIRGGGGRGLSRVSGVRRVARASVGKIMHVGLCLYGDPGRGLRVGADTGLQWEICWKAGLGAPPRCSVTVEY